MTPRPDSKSLPPLTLTLPVSVEPMTKSVLNVHVVGSLGSTLPDHPIPASTDPAKHATIAGTAVRIPNRPLVLIITSFRHSRGIRKPGAERPLSLLTGSNRTKMSEGTLPSILQHHNTAYGGVVQVKSGLKVEKRSLWFVSGNGMEARHPAVGMSWQASIPVSSAATMPYDPIGLGPRVNRGQFRMAVP